MTPRCIAVKCGGTDVPFVAREHRGVFVAQSLCYMFPAVPHSPSPLQKIILIFVFHIAALSLFTLPNSGNMARREIWNVIPKFVGTNQEIFEVELR